MEKEGGEGPPHLSSAFELCGLFVDSRCFALDACSEQHYLLVSLSYTVLRLPLVLQKTLLFCKKKKSNLAVAVVADNDKFKGWQRRRTVEDVLSLSYL